MKNNFYNRDWPKVVLIIALGLLLYSYNISGWDLWNPDEPRYAQVAKEMAETGKWMLPHLNGNVYHEKPPLVFWMVALSFKIFGSITEFAARFPIVLLAVIGLVCTYFLGKALFDPVTGILSSLVLATSVEYFWLSRRLALDIPITFFILLSLISFYQGYQKETGRRWYYLAFFCFIGLATLAKGPVGFILPLLTVIMYLALKGELRQLKEMRFGLGTCVFLLILLLWLVPAGLQGGKGYFQEIVLHQTVSRFFDAWAHRQPFYYYFEVFPAGFLPWIIFLPAAFICSFQAWRRKKEDEGDHLFPLVWFLVVFGFFTFSKGKRELYILPLYPAAAIITGKLWADYFTGQENSFVKRYMSVALVISACAMLIAGILPFFIQAKFSKNLAFLPTLSVIPITALFFVTAILLFVLRRRKTAYFTLILMMMICGMLYAVGSIMPTLNPLKSAKPVSREIISLMKPGDELVIYKKETSAFNFYTRIYPIQKIESREALAKVLTSDKRIFCLILKGDFEKVKGSLKEAFPLREATVGHRDFLLISNRSIVQQ
jgi:4-amino-4-deoxy-L-arabinose transferase-like glycosyltransferase